MPTKRFCNTSISSLQDFYENSTTDANELRLNLGEMFENRELAKHDSKLFAFAVKTKAGDVDLHGAIFALRFIADYIEEQQKIGRISNRVQFSFSVAEVAAKPKETMTDEGKAKFKKSLDALKTEKCKPFNPVISNNKKSIGENKE